MSTGISMSSVNKIKELADNGDYSLALDILEHQDLSKSLSPQFIRICGEVYYENGRYVDARAALVRAHSMAPVGNKIIYSIIKLYLSMGFRKQAEHYFEIYRFNQESKDAGTYRIEYMIAKAYHKPVNELYSILVSANDMETSEEWDYEMLLLHAFIRNKDKFDSAAIEFKAKYRNSSRLSTLDELMEDAESLESKVYVFPCEDRADDDPDQNNTREFERKILEEDDLKIHPKDAKIMIMVEDDAPVTRSMKFKQMWVRSKDKKEHKKELKREEAEEEDKKDRKRSRGLWGIMSKKEEELVDQEMQDIQSGNMNKEKLLDEVVAGETDASETVAVSGSDDEIAASQMAAAEAESSKPESGTEESETGAAQDMTEISAGDISAEDSAVYNAEDGKGLNGSDGLNGLNVEPDDLEDQFVIEEEPEEVVMVDTDLMTEESEEPDSGENGKTDSAQEETFDPEFSDEDDDSFFAAEDDVSISEELQTEDVDTSETNIPETNISESDTSETNTSETEAFDFDKAFESLEEFAVDDDEDFEIDQLADDIEDEEDSNQIIDDQTDIQEIDIPVEADWNDYESETGSMIEYEIDAAEPEMVNNEPEIWEIGQDEENFEKDIEENPENKFTDETAESEFEYEVDVDIDAEDEISADDSELVLGDEIQDNSPEENQEELYEVHDSSGEIHEESVKEEYSFRRYQSEKTRYADFPVFKSSLFPDYNTDGAKLYDVGNGKNPKIEEQIETEEAKITKNLQKEEDLIGETDRLLARLGIRFQTEFKSILDFSEDDAEVDGNTDGVGEETVQNSDGAGKDGDSEDSSEKSEVDNTEKPFNEKIDKDRKKEKKSFKLKG